MKSQLNKVLGSDKENVSIKQSTGNWQGKCLKSTKYWEVTRKMSQLNKVLGSDKENVSNQQSTGK